ncbi:MAG: SCP2 sterol-binding domain-containing protein [Pseudomonadota bacterium]
MTSPSDGNEILDIATRAFIAPFDAVLMLDVTDGAPIWVDGRSDPPLAALEAPADAAVTCAWRASERAMKRILDGERAIESAYVSGRLVVAGDMSVMARIKVEKTR